MFESISWQHFIIAVLSLSFIWYLIVILLYYRKELREFLKGNTSRRKVTQDLEEDHEEAFEELEEMVNKIRHSILLKAGREASKEELLEQLCDMLANYSGLRKPAYRIALNNFIIQNAESICGVYYNEQELDSAWETIQR